MNLSEIESSVHESIDAGDSETLDYFAEHCTESMNPLVESLCLAIIRTDFRAWSYVMAVAGRVSPGLVASLEAIEQHIDRNRAAFIESRASKLADLSEHDAQMLAELQAELNRG